MLLRLAALFIALPLVEWMLLMSIKERTSLPFTLALVIFTGAFGAWLARREGLQCWRRAQERISDGQIPADPLIDGLIILLAGALLVTPGIITDVVGFSLLVPPIRSLVKRRITARIKTRIVVGPAAPNDSRRTEYDEIIDVEHRPRDKP
jgi:UPF0716 protein FxsA